MHSAAAFVVLAISFSMFAAGWIGGGDAKLVAAIALWLGFDQLFSFLILASIFGGLLTVSLLMVRRYALPACLLGQELGGAPACADHRRALWHRAAPLPRS